MVNYLRLPGNKGDNKRAAINIDSSRFKSCKLIIKNISNKYQ